MNWPYAYTPYIWPMLASATFSGALGIYCLRRRSVPGAMPLAMAMLFAVLWAVSAALELAAVDVPTKIFWYKSVMAVCIMPMAIARLCFVLEYAGLGRLLTHRNLVLLSIPPLLQFLLVLTNDIHHWMWLGFVFDGAVRPLRGVGAWILTGFGYLLFLVILIIFVRLFFRSPPHRWPIALILCAMLSTHMVFMLDAVNINPFAPLDPAVLSMNIAFVMYALALFRFHIFDPIPAARKTAIEQMREGMLVLDTSGKIIDLNPAAESVLGLPAARVRGRDAAEVLPACAGLSAGEAQVEICLGMGSALRHYELSLSPLKDRSDVLLGHLLLLHDVTAQKRAQAQLLEQQRAVATLQERERLARELHDSVGQVLGYVSFQVEAARKLLGDGQTVVADAQLARVASITQDAHADVREYILNLRAGPSAQQPFFSALRHYLDGFTQNYDLQTGLAIGAGLDEGTFEPDAQVQLFRIIQEALSNARRHAGAKCVQVTFEREDNLARITIQDDGRGFDPAQPVGGDGNRFGLQFMRERAEQLGGCLRIHSVPGAGTRVVVEIPVSEGAR